MSRRATKYTNETRNNVGMRRLRQQRREDGLCVNGLAPKHGPAVRGGRCESCWTKKMDSERQPARLKDSAARR